MTEHDNRPMCTYIHVNTLEILHCIITCIEQAVYTAYAVICLRKIAAWTTGPKGLVLVFKIQS